MLNTKFKKNNTLNESQIRWKFAAIRCGDGFDSLLDSFFYENLRGRTPIPVMTYSVFWVHSILSTFQRNLAEVLLMEETLHQWIGSLSHYLQVLNIPGGWEGDFFHQQYDQISSG